MRIFDHRPLGGHKQDISSGYEGNHYHSKVIPAMTCGGCGKNRAGFVPVQRNDHGTVSVG